MVFLRYIEIDIRRTSYCLHYSTSKIRKRAYCIYADMNIANTLMIREEMDKISIFIGYSFYPPSIISSR